MKDEDLIYLFTGTSEIFIKNRMNRIIQSFNKYEYTIIKYDMETTSLSTVLSDAITVPFLEELKIIILKNPKFLTKSATSTKDEIKAMLKYLKNPCDSTLLIIDATNTVINQSNEIYKMLKNVARIIDYPDPEEIELKGWIVRSFDANGIDIKDDALTLLLEYIGDDQARLSQEIDKLSSYVGKGGTIRKEDIKLLVPKNINNEIYLLIKAIINHDLALTNQIYDNLITHTKDSLTIFSLISNKFKELLSTYRLLKYGYSQSDIAKFYNVSTGKAYYIVQEARAFKLSDLEFYIDKLAELDYQIKSGKLDKTIGLELLLLKLPKEK
ncbi:MAG TPA: DNA polymerase III subunit delta [Acholeplasmatales bacterium]|jgi:DNA polymerase III, delta subunit|nr:dNA polymerase III delta subunit [Firmicutes bacterium CAG:313]HCX08641.1 DNA polymerase III subunit delta [Acholeplasmatales bacterium]